MMYRLMRVRPSSFGRLISATSKRSLCDDNKRGIGQHYLEEKLLSLERDLDDIQSKLGMPDKTSGVEENQRQQHVKLSEPDSDSLDKKMVDWLEQAKKQLEETFNEKFKQINERSEKMSEQIEQILTAKDAVTKKPATKIAEKPVHISYCNACNTKGKYIVGVRFQCISASCKDFDLCENCYSKGEHSEHKDLFLRMNKRFYLNDYLDSLISLLHKFIAREFPDESSDDVVRRLLLSGALDEFQHTLHECCSKDDLNRAFVNTIRELGKSSAHEQSAQRSMNNE